MKRSNLILGLGIAMLSLMACDKDDPKPNKGGEEETGSIEKYVIAVKSTAPGDDRKADYLVTVDDVTKGSVSIVGNGIEQDGTYRYYVTSNNKFFSHKYGQANPGAMTTYELDAKGELKKVSDFQSETVQAFGPVQDDILMMKISRQATSPIANWYRLNTDKLEIVAEGEINTKELAEKAGISGEIAFFPWLKQFNDKLLLPFLTIKGSGGWGQFFDTNYPDIALVAIYSYPDMKLEKIIKDDRLSSIGAYFTDAVAVDEKGDAYVFSPSTRTRNKEIVSTKPCAIARILKSTNDFDNSYFFNVKEKSGGYYLTNILYAKEGKALGFFRKIGAKGSFYSGEKLGIIDLYNKTIDWVKGSLSEDIATEIVAMQSYISDDKNIIGVGITDKTNGESYVYNINVDNATAARGIKVEGGTITGIKKLKVEK